VRTALVCRGALGVVLLVSGALGASPAVSGTARLPVGLYGVAWTPWLVERPGGVDFVLYQVGTAERPAEVWRAVRSLGRAGIEVVLVVMFYESRAQRAGRSGAAPAAPIETYERRFDELLAAPERSSVAGVVIEEENVFWAGRAGLLDALYGRLKQRYPDVTFYQWYSGARRVNVPGREWPSLRADGWVIDSYLLEGESYERLVRGYLALGLPLLSIVWASPNWPSDAGRPKPDPGWWEREGSRIFTSQVGTNARLRVPTALFPYWVSAGTPGLVPLWRSTEPCARAFMGWLVSKGIPGIRDGAMRPERAGWVPRSCPSLPPE
jgi:hypothetical protein